MSFVQRHQKIPGRPASKFFLNVKQRRVLLIDMRSSSFVLQIQILFYQILDILQGRLLQKCFTGDGNDASSKISFKVLSSSSSSTDTFRRECCAVGVRHSVWT
jgi:hypothetical protein